jgi:hypothetical protein
MERRLARSGRVLTARETELEERFRELDADIAVQHRIIQQLGEEGRSAVGANTVLRLFENEQFAIMDELGYDPRLN